MLVDITKKNISQNMQMLFSLCGPGIPDKHIQTGVYQIGHFSFDEYIEEEHNHYPDLDEFSKDIHCYGVCDSAEQLLKNLEESGLIKSNRKFVIAITLIEKSEQSPSGGWRWHKWGPYIGEHEITTEYLYDEEKIERVYVYHIYELTNPEFLEIN